MNIAYDGGALSIKDERLAVGVHRVTTEIINRTASLYPQHQLTVYGFLRNSPFPSGPVNITYTPLLPAQGYMKVRLPLALSALQPKAFIGTAQALPKIHPRLLPHCAMVGIVYDVGFLFHKDAYGTAYRALVENTAYLVQRSDAVIAISETTKNDIVRAYGTPDTKVSVVHLGVDAHFFTPRAPYSHPRPYFLFVGSLNKAKDIPTLIEAFGVAVKLLKLPHDLLLAGGDYWPDEHIDETITRYNLEQRVIRLGRVSDDDLIRLYAGAVAFVTSAFHEGFCLPAAEAMAAGTPVISFARGAMKEIVGDGGVVISNGTIEDFVKALYKIATSTRYRAHLSRKAVSRAKTFSWNQTTEKIMRITTEAVRHI